MCIFCYFDSPPKVCAMCAMAINVERSRYIRAQSTHKRTVLNARILNNIDFFDRHIAQIGDPNLKVSWETTARLLQCS